MDLKLTGRTVFVSGGSGGIGRQIVRQFASEGANVIVHYHSNERSARQLVEAIGPDRAMAVDGNLARESDVRAAFAAAADQFGRLHILVACAGVWPVPDTPLHRMSLEQWQDTMDNNLTSAFLSCRAFLERLIEDPFDDPAIVLVGSTAAVFGESGHGDYAASKSGLTYGLMLSLKNEIARLAPRGRVNTVCPGWTVTPMAEKFTGDGQALCAALATIAMRKVAAPADIANAVLFLASSGVAGHISGQVLTVSGGMEGRQLYDPDEIDIPSAMPPEISPTE